MGLRASFNDAYVQSTSSDNARRYATSWLLPTRTLGVIRAMLALYGFVVSFTVIGVLNSWGGSWLAGGNFGKQDVEDQQAVVSLSTQVGRGQGQGLGLTRAVAWPRLTGYFTTLSYWALNCYFVVAAIYSLHWSRVSRHGRDAGERDTLLSRLPAPLIFAHASLYATLAVFAPLITIIFWGILARVHGANATGYPFATFSNVSQHALNSVAAAFEIVATDAPVPSWLCLGPIILVLALYLCLTAVFKAARGYAVYPFLDQ